MALLAPQQLRDLLLICPKPYFRLVNNSKQWHNHKVHEKLIKINIRHTPNGATAKRYKPNKLQAQTVNDMKHTLAQCTNRLSNANMLQIDMQWSRHDIQGIAKRIIQVGIMVYLL